MNIIYVTSLYRPEDFGGSRYPLEVTRRLAARGHKVRVVTSARNGILPVTGLELATYRDSSDTPVHTLLTHMIGALIALRRALRGFAPDIFVYQSYESAFLQLSRARWLMAPSVYVYHSRFVSDSLDRLAAAPWPLSAVHQIGRRFMRFAERTVLTRVDAIFTVSRFAEREIAERGGGTAAPVTVIPAGIDTQTFRPGDRRDARRALDIHEDECVLLTVGRLSPVKRYDKALAATARVAGSLGRWRLALVGDGPEKRRLEHLAQDLGIRDHISFDGYREGRELLRRYWAADLQLATSDWETLGLSVLEGLATGLPVLGVPNGAIPDILRRVDRSLVTETDSVDDIADGIVKFRSDPEVRLQLSRLGRDMVVREFDWERIIDRLETHLERVVATARGRQHPAG